ncbi:unnamed protein product [Boreogadus saida]
MGPRWKETAVRADVVWLVWLLQNKLLPCSGRRTGSLAAMASSAACRWCPRQRWQQTVKGFVVRGLAWGEAVLLTSGHYNQSSIPSVGITKTKNRKGGSGNTTRRLERPRIDGRIVFRRVYYLRSPLTGYPLGPAPGVNAKRHSADADADAIFHGRKSLHFLILGQSKIWIQEAFDDTDLRGLGQQ